MDAIGGLVVGDEVVYFHITRKTGSRYPHLPCIAASKGRGVVTNVSDDVISIRTPQGGHVRRKTEDVILQSQDSPSSILERVARVAV